MKAVFERYKRSYFDRKPIPRPLTAADRMRARREYEADPMASILANITEAQEAVRETTRTYYEAQKDGLFDGDAFKAATRREREAWAKIADLVHGDYDRANCELLHWTAIKNGPPLPSRVPRSVNQLAEEKAADYGPDTDDDTNRQRRVAVERLAHWSEAQRQPGEGE